MATCQRPRPPRPAPRAPWAVLGPGRGGSLHRVWHGQVGRRHGGHVGCGLHCVWAGRLQPWLWAPTPPRPAPRAPPGSTRPWPPRQAAPGARRADSRSRAATRRPCAPPAPRARTSWAAQPRRGCAPCAPRVVQRGDDRLPGLHRLPRGLVFGAAGSNSSAACTVCGPGRGPACWPPRAASTARSAQGAWAGWGLVAVVVVCVRVCVGGGGGGGLP
jgi:hypothetical protein